MNIDEYQKKAYSTAVFGGELNYPIAALSEEVGEVCAVWAEWLKDTEYHKLKLSEVKAKLLDEMGDVLWNIAALCELIDTPLSVIEKYAVTSHTNNAVPLSYYLCNLTAAVGKLNGIWAKYIRKHDGQEPKVEDVKQQDSWTDSLRSNLIAQCMMIFHILYNVAVRLELDLNEIMNHNIEKLAARKAANTLGGKGSVERK